MDEIKVGDIVRFSYDTTPRIYLIVNNRRDIGIMAQCVVEDIQDGNAVIHADSDEDARLVIPTKYLIKVNAEPKYSKGDKVSYCDELYVVTNITVVGRERNIHYTIERDYDKSITSVAERFLEPYTEPKEPTIAEEPEKPLDFKKTAEDWATTISNGLREFGDNARRIMEEAHVEAYWDVYAADLAKEIVLKKINSASDQRPSAIGAYAVDVAKSVVENLKKSEE